MTTRQIKAANDNSSADSPDTEKLNCYNGAIQSIVELLARAMVATDRAANDNRAPKENAS
jgi:hypothetical protein